MGITIVKKLYAIIIYFVVLQALMYLKELQSERGGKCQTETLDENASDVSRFVQFMKATLSLS